MCKQKNNTMFLTKIIVYVQVDRKKKKKSNWVTKKKGIKRTWAWTKTTCKCTWAFPST